VSVFSFFSPSKRFFLELHQNLSKPQRGVPQVKFVGKSKLPIDLLSILGHSLFRMILALQEGGIDKKKEDQKPNGLSIVKPNKILPIGLPWYIYVRGIPLLLS